MTPWRNELRLERKAMFEKVKAAEQRLRGQAHVTPVMTSRTLDQLAGAEVFLKCENFQRGGAFKFRGAYNAMSQLSGAEKTRGVITYSSGNHAQAVAIVGKLLGIKTTVVMPHNAPRIKRQATEQYGAIVVACDAAERLSVAEKLQKECGYTMVPPFDHQEIIAGQGTATMELFSQVAGIDTLLVPCGGGGLLSGSAIAAKHLSPGCRVIGVEPASGDDGARSFRSKSLQRVENCQSVADGTRTPSLGNVTFPIILEYVDGFATVTEEAICDGVRFLFSRMKLVAEPSGVLGVAALLSRAVQPGKRVGVIISGGNIDPQTASHILGK